MRVTTTLTASFVGRNGHASGSHPEVTGSVESGAPG